MSLVWGCRLVVGLSLILIMYPYTIFPATLWILSRLRPRPWRREPCTPSMSVIIAAFNEEGVIRQKLENTLAFDYPAEQLEVIVASDCSSDRTDAIVSEFAPRVRLVRLRHRSGKQVAVNTAVAQATRDILLFTDASVMLDRQLAATLARNFADESVGAVSSVIVILADKRDRTAGAAEDEEAARPAEASYLDLDLSTRRLEASIGSAVGCCGSCYAVRRACFRPFDPGAANDFASALDAVRCGFRVVMDEDAIGAMRPAKDARGEFRRKARTIAGGIDTWWRSGAAWTGLIEPLFWWQLISHKVMRWLGPPLLFVVAIACLVGALAGDAVLMYDSLAGGAAVAIGLLAILLPNSFGRIVPARLAGFALISWAAGIWAWVLFLSGRRQVVWQPTAR